MKLKLIADDEGPSTIKMRCPSCYRYGAPTRFDSGKCHDVIVDDECSWCHGVGHVLCEASEREMADA